MSKINSIRLSFTTFVQLWQSGKGYLGMAAKGSSVIQAMLKRLAEEEMQQKQEEAKVSVDATRPLKARAVAF